MSDTQKETATTTPNGEICSLGGETSMSAWKVVGIYLCVSVLGSFLCRGFVSVMPLPEVDPDIIVVSAEMVAAVFVICILLRWHPEMARRLSFRFDLRFLPFACALGLLGGNVCFLIHKTMGGIGYSQFDVFTIVLFVLVVPVVEETFCRGIILESLLQRHRLLFSVLLSTILIAFDHASFWPALVGQVMLSLVYLGSRRSLTMSIIAHAVSNLATGFPLDIFRYTHYFKGW